MSYESATDALTAAMAVLCTSNVTSALAPTLGADYPAVRESRAWPVAPELLESRGLPIASVYVRRESAVRATLRKVDSRADVIVEYFAPVTPMSKLGSRWPLLRAVYAALRDAVLDGGVAALADGLASAGVISVLEDAFTVDYDFATDGEQAIPHFVAVFPMITRPVSAEVTQAFLALHADFNRVDAPADQQPQVEANVTVPA